MIRGSRRFTTEELARLYQVPPPIVGIWDHSSFTNSETAGRWFAQFTLAPWIRKIEAEFARSVFTAAGRESHHVEFDLSGFLRGDPAQRWQGYDVALRNRVLTPNEVRQAEGYIGCPRTAPEHHPGSVCRTCDMEYPRMRRNRWKNEAKRLETLVNWPDCGGTVGGT